MKKDLEKKWLCLRQTMKKGDCSLPQLATHSWPPQGRTTFYWLGTNSKTNNFKINFQTFKRDTVGNGQIREASVDGDLHYQGDAKWIVIRGQLGVITISVTINSPPA
jgi:hypothetical protein